MEAEVHNQNECQKDELNAKIEIKFQKNSRNDKGNHGGLGANVLFVSKRDIQNVPTLATYWYLDVTLFLYNWTVVALYFSAYIVDTDALGTEMYWDSDKFIAVTGIF